MLQDVCNDVRFIYMQHALILENVKKTYVPTGKVKGVPKEALKGVSLEVPRGSFFGLLGPNGAGKSTLINILAGLVLKSSGRVLIDGLDQDVDAKATRYRIGVVPQEVVLDPFFPVGELLEYYSGFYGIPPEKRRVQHLLEALSLADKKDTAPRRLSGGMRRRVLIAKALVHSPPIVILDEPTAGVDVELRHQLWAYVRELNAQGTTVILTTHYLEEAQELCDRIAIINHGQFIACDTKANILSLMDSKELLVTLSESIAHIPPALSVYAAELLNPFVLKLRFMPSKTHGIDVLQHIASAGLVVKDFSTQEPDLETIFRHLIQAQAEAA
jgi:ABC-2 type transport system ATP-binding protein